MTETDQALPAESAGTEITRFNALKHGILSRYTVLPWEDKNEYQVLVDALVVEHAERTDRGASGRGVGRHSVAQAAAAARRASGVSSGSVGRSETLQ